MQVLNIFHVLIAIALVVFVLIQKGQGATAGAAFGSGASGTVFGARGAGNFLSRTTGILATVFFVTSLALAYFAMQSDEPETLMESALPARVPSALTDTSLVTPSDQSNVAATDRVIGNAQRRQHLLGLLLRKAAL